MNKSKFRSKIQKFTFRFVPHPTVIFTKRGEFWWMINSNQNVWKKPLHCLDNPSLCGKTEQLWKRKFSLVSLNIYFDSLFDIDSGTIRQVSSSVSSLTWNVHFRKYSLNGRVNFMNQMESNAIFGNAWWNHAAILGNDTKNEDFRLRTETC